MKKYQVFITLHGKEFTSVIMEEGNEILDAVTHRNKYSAVHVDLIDGSILCLNSNNLQDAIVVAKEIK
jgi:hypothetical protein